MKVLNHQITMNMVFQLEKDKDYSGMTDRLKAEFPDVFTASLKDSHIKMDPVKIELKEGVKSKHKPATTTREVPIYYEKEAKKQIKKILEEGLIVEVTEPTVYCSRHTFLPKSDGVLLRLITDYRTVN